MDQWISVLVALVCLSSPSISRSWVGPGDQHDVNYNYELKSWHDGPDYRPNHGWEHDDFSSDYDSSEEDSWEHNDDFEDHQGYGHGHGYEKKGHGGYPHDHEYHAFDQQHGNYGYHHNHHGHNHHEHGQVNDDNKQEYHGHSSQGAGSSGSANNSPGETNKNEGKVNHVQLTKTAEPPVQVDLSKNNQNKKQVPKDDTERIVFPDSRQARSSSTSTLTPPTSSTTTPSTTTTTTTPSTTTTTTSSTTPPAPMTTPGPAASPSLPTLLDIIICIRACPVTSEYNPVCGSNNFTYNNPGGLECARNCGANVTLSRRAPCARPILELESTASPDAKETVTTTATVTTGPVETTQPPTTEAPVTANPTRFTDITDKLKLLFRL